MWPFKYPYTNFHELNLDWMLEKVKQNSDALKQVPGLIDKKIGDLLVSIDSQFVTPQMFGAKADGVTDDTDSIESAISASNFVFLPQGTYKISRAITLPYACSIFGAGQDLSEIKNDDNSNGLILTGSNTISNFAIRGQEHALSGTLLNVNGLYSKIENIKLWYGWDQAVFSGSGHSVESVFALNAKATSVNFKNANDVYCNSIFAIGSNVNGIVNSEKAEAIILSNSTVLMCKRPFVFNTGFKFCKISNCYFDSGEDDAILYDTLDVTFSNVWFSSRVNKDGHQRTLLVNGSKNITFADCDFVNNNRALQISLNSKNIKIIGCMFDSNKDKDIFADPTSGIIISDCSFSSIYDPGVVYGGVAFNGTSTGIVKNNCFEGQVKISGHEGSVGANFIVDSNVAV